MAQKGIRQIGLSGIYPKVLRFIDAVSPKNILEVGAGRGALTAELLSRGCKVVPVDILPELFEVEDLACSRMDANEHFPFDDGAFDCVIAIEVIEHLENQFQFMRECARVLRPGGCAIISTPNLHSIESRLSYFFTGYDDSSPVPIHNEDNIYLKHIHPLPLAFLELMTRIDGFCIEGVSVNRIRKLSVFLLPFFYPIFAIMTMRRLFIKKRNQRLIPQRRKVLRLLLEPKLLVGRIGIYLLRKE